MGRARVKFNVFPSYFTQVPRGHGISCAEDPVYWMYRGQIRGQNPDTSLRCFPPCYSQSPLQLCIEISIYTLKEKGGKPD
jgi:hypothetical protein